MNMEKFIQGIRNRPCLWNRMHKHHHNRFVLEKEWDDVAKEFKITREVARSKWKSLRDKFRIELSRISKEMVCNPEVNYDSVIWTHFNSLLFMKDQFLDKKLYECMLQDGNDSVDVKNEDSSSQSFINISMGSPSVSQDDQIVAPPSSPSPKSNFSNTKKRLKANTTEQTLINIEMEKIKMFNEWSKMIQDEGEEMHFFRSIAVYVKDLPPMEKLNFRMKVMKAVQEALSDQSVQ